MNKIQAKELKEVLNNTNDTSKLTVLDAMTPANFDWMYDTIKTALKACDMHHSDMEIAWIMSITFPVSVYSNDWTFLPALVNFILEDKKNHADIYERLNHYNDILAGLGFKVEKEALTAHSKDYFEDIRMPDDAKIINIAESKLKGITHGNSTYNYNYAGRIEKRS